jgi:anaphase-promoting complex subunit 6
MLQSFLWRHLFLTFITKALSIDPINGHLIELLNLALESDLCCGSLEKVYPGGEEAFRAMMVSLKTKVLDTSKKPKVDKPGGDVAMSVG